MGDPNTQKEAKKKEEEAEQQTDEGIAMGAIQEEEMEDQRVIQRPSQELRDRRDASDKPIITESRPESREASRDRITSKILKSDI